MVKRSKPTKTRDVPGITTLRNLRKVRFKPPLRRSTKTLLTDRRLYSPPSFLSPLSKSRSKQIGIVNTVSKKKQKNISREILGFVNPKGISICQKRNDRKRVIHAKGKAGTKVRQPKWNAFSKISCRRK